jgi:hypothetical protein
MSDSRMRQACPSPGPRRTRLRPPGCCLKTDGSLGCEG